MHTIGEIFNQARRQQGDTLASLENKTKIKKEFLRAIEASEWSVLPEYPVLLGFIKNIAKALHISEAKAVAIFRRDYPPSKVRQIITPKPPLKKELHISPKLTFFVGILAIVIMLVSYLGFQYSKFIQSPSLTVLEPTQGQVVRKTTLKVAGKTDPDAVVKVNNQPVLVDQDGNFGTEIDIFEGTLRVDVSATSRSGKTTFVSRIIEPQLESK